MEAIKEALTFDDVLLLPRYSNILPSETDISLNLTKNIKLKTPFLSSAMDTVTESSMAIAMAKSGGIGIIHRNLDIKKQIKEVKKVKRKKLFVGAAIGTNTDDLKRGKLLIDSGVDLIVIDTAHGHSSGVLKSIEKIKKSVGDLQVIAGNVATSDGVKALIDSGVDAVKVGIGAGASCTTRIVAGVGMPQLSGIMNSVDEAKKQNIPVIADGGIRYSGDLSKAIAAGAETVMLGSMLAGMDESPGEFILFEGRQYKSYRGMGSLGAMKQGSGDRYFQENSEATKLVPEGIEGMVPYRGPVRNTIHQLMGGLRSSMGYCGAKDIKDFHKKAQFIQTTTAGIKESHPHEVKIMKEAPNYQVSDS